MTGGKRAVGLDPDLGHSEGVLLVELLVQGPELRLITRAVHGGGGVVRGGARIRGSPPLSRSS